jgi:hypothetical protein
VEWRERADKAHEALAERDDGLAKTALALRKLEERIAAEKKVRLRCPHCVPRLEFVVSLLRCAASSRG